MIVIDVPASLWLTSNSRPHRAQKWTTVKAVRALGKAAAAASGERYEVASCLVTVSYPHNRIADPPNTYDPVVKAFLDGVVDAHVLPNDDSRHIVLTSFERGLKAAAGTYRITLTFTDQEASV